MTDPVALARLVTSTAFVLLGLAITARWLANRDRARGFLALAIGGIALASLIGRLQLVLTGPAALVAQEIALVSFMGSGYGLILFRDLFIPYRAGARTTIGVVVLVTTIVGAVNAALSAGRPAGPVQAAVVLLLIGVWSATVLEPAIRFLIASRQVPSVQRARLRALAIGFIGLAAVLIISGGAGSGLGGAGQIAIQCAALLLVPFLYLSFMPPAWVRRGWRLPEEDALREAIQELLLYSPDRATLALRAAEWGRRLVGGDAAVIAAPDGRILAEVGMGEEQARGLLAGLETVPATPRVIMVAGRPAVFTGLPLEDGTGVLAVLAGPFTPVFGSEELGLLHQYSSSITVGLDRTRLTERMAALERTKSEFLNLASHELRGPITVIRGYLSMMQNGTMGATSPAVQSALPVLAAKADHMNVLIEQMIEAARLEEGRLELKPELVDLRRIAEQAVELMRPLGDVHHEIVLKTHPEEVTVEVDPGRVSTIITNLIDNAIKYSPRGGSVRCEVESLHDEATVRVTDSGIGIDPSDLPRLFTRFGRITTQETQHIGGTGLGLYLCRELARLHGGDITVESRPGAGSTFQLSVPIRSGGV